MEIIIKSKKYGIKSCLIDDCDAEEIVKHVWSIVPNRMTFYAMTRVKVRHGKYRNVRMHRMIMNINGFIDHRDGNGLNNKRSNLRESTTQQNNFNVGITKRNKSGYKGVYKSSYNTYIACIRKSGKLYHGGTFKTPEEAALKYNDLAIIHHGEFARLNIL